MTLEQFRLSYKEFSQIEDSVIETKLGEAALRVSECAFGNRYDFAHGLMTAHALWSSPFGATMRLDGGGEQKASPYLRDFARLRVEVIPSIIVT